MLLLLVLLLTILLLLLLPGWLILRGNMSTLLLVMLLAGLLGLLATTSLRIEGSNNRRDLALLSLLLLLSTLTLLLLFGLITKLDVITMTLRDTLTTRTTIVITTLSEFYSTTIDMLGDMRLLEASWRLPSEWRIGVLTSEVLIDERRLQNWGRRTAHRDGAVGIGGIGNIPSSSRIDNGCPANGIWKGTQLT